MKGNRLPDWKPQFFAMVFQRMCRYVFIRGKTGSRFRTLLTYSRAEQFVSGAQGRL